jgi:hypothetical protein
VEGRNRRTGVGEGCIWREPGRGTVKTTETAAESERSEGRERVGFLAEVGEREREYDDGGGLTSAGDQQYPCLLAGVVVSQVPAHISSMIVCQGQSVSTLTIPLLIYPVHF